MEIKHIQWDSHGPAVVRVFHSISDRGCSFPSSYLRARDIWTDGSFMLSIAKIPLGKLNFTGCLCTIHLNGKEYRIATNLGARVKQWNAQYASVWQGRYLLVVEVLRK